MYKQLREECLSLYLLVFLDPLEQYFPATNHWELEYGQFVGWLSTFNMAIQSLLLYDPETKKWDEEAENYLKLKASFMIMQLIRTHEDGPVVLKFEFSKKGHEDHFEIVFGNFLMMTAAFDLLRSFIQDLHTFDEQEEREELQELFEKYSEVDEEMLKVR